jgi:hypothetical protein
VNLNVRHDRCAQSFRRETVIPQPEGPRAAMALCHAAHRHVRACRQKPVNPERLGRRRADDAQAGCMGRMRRRDVRPSSDF